MDHYFINFEQYFRNQPNQHQEQIGFTQKEINILELDPAHCKQF